MVNIQTAPSLLRIHFQPLERGNSPTRTTVASAFSGIFSSSFSSCLDLERCIPYTTGGSFCCKREESIAKLIKMEAPDLFQALQLLTHLHFVLLHFDACLRFPRRVDGSHERVGHRRLSLMGVVGAVVVRYQAAQAGRRDVPGERATVLLLIARVTTGGREREGEVEEERQRPGWKPSSVRKRTAASGEGRVALNNRSNLN